MIRQPRSFARGVYVCMLFFFCAAAYMLAPHRTHAQSTPPAGSEWTVLAEIDPFIERISNNNLPDENGALGRNQDGYFSVRFQEMLSDTLIQGLINRDVHLVELGVAAIEYGFDYQNTDGSFPVDTPPSVPLPKPLGPLDYARGGTFFLAEVGRSLLLMAEHRWFQTSSETTSLRARIEAVKPKAGLALDYLKSQQSLLNTYDPQWSNQLFRDAAGIYMTARAIGRTDMLSFGTSFANTALSNQWANGVFPEKYGYDSSYQAVSLLNALILYLHVPSTSQLRKNLWTGITKGVQWELTRILPDGRVNTDGNTRVYPGGEIYLGTEKGVAYVSLVQALKFYGVLADDAQALAAATSVDTYYSITIR